MAEENPTAALQRQEGDSLAKDPACQNDLSARVDEVLAHLPEDIDEALEVLLAAEKECRQALDGASCCRLVDRLLDMCSAANQWEKLMETARILCRKRGQLKRVITQIVHRGADLVKKCPDRDTEKKLLTCLADMSDSRIFVEVERARLVLHHALLLESEGDTDAAAQLLQDVPVEAFGAMDRLERSKFILEQMRLVLKRGDFLRLQLLSKKMSPKLLETEEMRLIKRQYNKYMVSYFVHEQDALGAANAWRCIAETYTARSSDDVPEEDLEPWTEAINHYLHWLMLAPHSEELMGKLQKFKKTYDNDRLHSIATSRRLVSDFLQFELVDWPLPYEAELRRNGPLAEDVYFQQFRDRFYQRNVMTLTKCYTRVKAEDAAAMLKISVADFERTIAALVNARAIYAKIDRPNGIVEFRKPRQSHEILDDWTQHVAKILDLVQETTHLINNERMLRLAQSK